MNYLDLATRVAQANASHNKHFSFGCVAIREDNAIIISSNIRTRDPIVSAHAESRAIRKSGYGAILYVVRIDRRGQWGMAKPCEACQSLIRNHNIKRVYYSVSPETYAVWNVQCHPMSVSAMPSRKSKLKKLSV